MGYHQGEAEELNIVPNCLHPRRFIEEQANAMVLENKFYAYCTGSELAYEREYMKKNPNCKYRDIINELNKIIKDEVIPFAYIVEYLEFTKERSKIKKINIIIYGLYFICFCYMLLYYIICLLSSVPLLLFYD